MSSTMDRLRAKPESYRHKLAFFTATFLSLVVFVGWAGFEGYIRLPNGEVSYNESQQNIASVAASNSTNVLTPFDNSKNALRATMEQFSKQFGILKESLSNVFVPFISGIEVYESK